MPTELTEAQQAEAKALADLGIKNKVAAQLARDGYTVNTLASTGLDVLIEDYNLSPAEADKIRQAAIKAKTDEVSKSVKIQRIHDANEAE